MIKIMKEFWTRRKLISRLKRRVELLTININDLDQQAYHASGVSYRELFESMVVVAGGLDENDLQNIDIDKLRCFLIDYKTKSKGEITAFLQKMMRDPRYWRDKNPEYVAKVTAAFKNAYGDSE